MGSCLVGVYLFAYFAMFQPLFAGADGFSLFSPLMVGCFAGFATFAVKASIKIFSNSQFRIGMFSRWVAMPVLIISATSLRLISTFWTADGSRLVRAQIQRVSVDVFVAAVVICVSFELLDWVIRFRRDEQTNF